MKDLIQIREEIDRIDDKLIHLYEKRMALTSEVAAYKIETGKPVLDQKREKEKLSAVEEKAKSPFTARGLRELFEQIMAMSRKRQYQLLTERGLSKKTDYQTIDAFDFSGAKIVFQGTEGAYAQMALKEYFGECADGYHVDTWRDAMEEIRSGAADYAVLPIENSSAGIVSENYDLLMEYDNCIIGEHILKIDHALLGIKGSCKEGIRQVYSHPQALMQCAGYLDAHREWEKLSSKNTAVSAKKIKEDDKKEQAAIASRITADIYGLEVLEECIQDNKENFTRFIIVAAKKIFKRDAKRLSICFEIPHESGSLYHTLSHFIYNNLNLNKIESRPIPGKKWEYRFFVDVEGNLMDSAVQNALNGLLEETAKFKILGNY